MFDKFKELFHREDLLDDAFHTTMMMLEFDMEMYDASRKTLRDTNTAELPFDIKATDRKINKYERQVRRHVLTHLSISGTADLVPGLVLVSIVIDVERIGDYTKNIYDLARNHPKKLHGGDFEPSIIRLETAIAEHFPQTIEVLKTQNKTTGRSVMKLEQELSTISDDIVNSLAQGEGKDISVADGVSLAMYARYLKRINAHLTNVVSAIVNPFPRIGFREKPKN
jgi:phosphate uptake regulator